MEIEVNICYIYNRGLILAHERSLVTGLVSGNSHGFRIDDFVGIPVGNPIPSRAFNHPNNYSIRDSDLHPVFGYYYVHLFQSASG